MVPPFDEKVHALESGWGESPRLRQSAPAPLTDGYRTWYMTAMGVSFFFWSFTKENKRRECTTLCGSEKNQSCLLKKFMKIKFFCFWAVEFIILQRNAFLYFILGFCIRQNRKLEKIDRYAFWRTNEYLLPGYLLHGSKETFFNFSYRVNASLGFFFRNAFERGILSVTFLKSTLC